MKKVPIRIVEGELESAKFYIAATFNGHTEDFHLDTGSTYTLIAHNDFSAKLPVISFIDRTSAANKTVRDEIISVKTFKVGNLDRSSFSAVRGAAGNSAENRIGMSGLSDDQATFDFRENTLEFGVPIPERIATSPLCTYSQGLFGFRVETGGKELNSLWDTGAELSVIDRDFVDSNPATFHFLQKIDNGQDALGNWVPMDLYLVDVLKIGLEDMACVLLAMDFTMLKQKIGAEVKLIVGTNLMRGRRWHFDFEAGLWAQD
jgi:predicted aspartyl protease